jgi:hypothetical protein
MKLWKITATEYVEAETADGALDASELKGKIVRASLVEITDADVIDAEFTVAGWDLDALYEKAVAEDRLPWKDAAS